MRADVEGVNPGPGPTFTRTMKFALTMSASCCALMSVMGCGDGSRTTASPAAGVSADAAATRSATPAAPAADSATTMAADIDRSVARGDICGVSWAAAEADMGPSTRLDAAIVRALRATPFNTIAMDRAERDDGRRVAIDLLLDDAIRRKIALPDDLIAGRDGDYQHRDAYILLMAAHPADHGATLLRWFTGRDDESEWAALCAGLTAIRAPGFAAELLRELNITVDIVVVVPGNGGGGGSRFAGRSGDGVLTVPAGFPADVGWHLTLDQEKGDACMAAAPLPVYARRTVYAPGVHGIGSHTNIPDRDPVRLHAISMIMGTTVDALPLQSTVSTEIPWTTADAYAAAVVKLRGEIAEHWAALADRLVDMDLLTRGERAGLSLKTQEEITDLRGNAAPTLPVVPAQDAAGAASGTGGAVAP